MIRLAGNEACSFNKKNISFRNVSAKGRADLIVKWILKKYGART
jgi:hypothetical protein